jgi:hypothetical protein
MLVMGFVSKKCTRTLIGDDDFSVLLPHHAVRAHEHLEFGERGVQEESKSTIMPAAHQGGKEIQRQ